MESEFRVLEILGFEDWFIVFLILVEVFMFDILFMVVLYLGWIIGYGILFEVVLWSDFVVVLVGGKLFLVDVNLYLGGDYLFLIGDVIDLLDCCFCWCNL